MIHECHIRQEVLPTFSPHEADQFKHIAYVTARNSGLALLKRQTSDCSWGFESLNERINKESNGRLKMCFEESTKVAAVEKAIKGGREVFGFETTQELLEFAAEVRNV